MLKGSYVALITPFKNNSIDYEALEKLLEFHLNNHTDGILLCGTTAETPSLAGDEKNLLNSFSMKKISGKVPVMIGTGTNNLNHTLSQTIRAKEMGADYALIVTPYYNKPTQEGLYLYYSEIAKNCTIPIVIYNVPSRTGVNILPSTVVRLAQKHPNIIGIKEASANILQTSEIIRDLDDDFSLMSGEDALTFPLLTCGAKGVISVTANIIPEKMHDLCQLTFESKYKEALELHNSLLEIHRLMFLETNPIPVKESLHLMGMIEREIRLPLCKISESHLQELKTGLKNCGII